VNTSLKATSNTSKLKKIHPIYLSIQYPLSVTHYCYPSPSFLLLISYKVQHKTTAEQNTTININQIEQIAIFLSLIIGKL